jgi:oligosaccharide reducing-end xylanase
LAVRLIACWLFLAIGVPPTPAGESPRSFATGNYPNLFREQLGRTEAEIDAKIDGAFQQLFHGNDDTQRVYYPVDGEMAYIADIGNGDVRSEGMSYGMMIAVQLGRRDEFNRIWKWARTHMHHAAGPRAGYFAWHCKFDGTPLSPNSASDGEEWFAMALLFASHRWGNGAGIFDYGAEAEALLRAMLHKPRGDGVTAIFDREQKQVVFVPTPDGSRITDPSYHLPCFYELWGRWTKAPEDRAFWADAARTSRAFFKKAAHPRTGLMPEYAKFDGQPHAGYGADKVDFRFDAWRTLAHVALDYTWFGADPWQAEQSTRVLKFLLTHAPNIPNQFALDGKPLSTTGSSGLIAMAAVAALAAEPDAGRPFVQQLWDLPVPAGKWRYYNGMLYLLALLEVSGRFQIHGPTSR